MGYLRRIIQRYTIKKLLLLIVITAPFIFLITIQHRQVIYHLQQLITHQPINVTIDDLEVFNHFNKAYNFEQGQSSMIVRTPNFYSIKKIIPLPQDPENQSSLLPNILQKKTGKAATDHQYWIAIIGHYALPLKLKKNADIIKLQEKPLLASLYTIDPQESFHIFLRDEDIHLASQLSSPALQSMLAEDALTLLPSVRLIAAEIDDSKGFTLFLLILCLIPIILIIHTLWRLIFPLRLSEFKALAKNYGISIPEIANSVQIDHEKKRVISKKGVTISDHFIIIQTFRQTRVIPISELAKLDLKKGIDPFAYLWWLPKSFLYVTEDRRSYRIRVSKKMILAIFKRVHAIDNNVALPIDLLALINHTDSPENNTEPYSDNRGQRIHANPILSEMEHVSRAAANTRTQSTQQDQPSLLTQKVDDLIFSPNPLDSNIIKQQLYPLFTFTLRNTIVLSLLLIITFPLILISPIAFPALYALTAGIYTVIRIIKLFKNIFKPPNILGISFGFITITLLILIPYWVFQLGTSTIKFAFDNIQ